jgi:hypothetical protein
MSGEEIESGIEEPLDPSLENTARLQKLYDHNHDMVDRCEITTSQIFISQMTMDLFLFYRT